MPRNHRLYGFHRYKPALDPNVDAARRVKTVREGLSKVLDEIQVRFEDGDGLIEIR
jgi:hypothetical protein